MNIRRVYTAYMNDNSLLVASPWEVRPDHDSFCPFLPDKWNSVSFTFTERSKNL